MKIESEAKRLFAEMVGREDEEINLGEASLLFAKEIEYPNLEIAKYMGRIDLIAGEIKSRIKHETDPSSIISGISGYLFDVEGFSGNEENYYEPRNSFLNSVLDRKTGIPITLSVLYIEIGYRLGLSILGVGFPGHFIVKYSGSRGEILIDPFNRGRLLSERDCQEILNRIYGGVKLTSDLLEPATNRQILTRMLHNLKNIYLDSKNYIKALSVADLILLVDPMTVNEIRDRGLIYYRLDCFIQALYDLETYLKRSPYAQDSEMVRQLVVGLKNLVSKMS